MIVAEHGRRQDDFQGGAPDNSRGVHKDFPKGFTLFSVHKQISAYFQAA